MRRAALLCVALWAGAAAAYIPSVGSIFRRSVARADEVDRSKGVTLRGMLQLGTNAPQAATLELRFPLRCRLHTEGDKAPGAVAVRGDPSEPQIEDEGKALGAARDLLALACPLLTYKGGGRNEGERTLRATAVAAGAQLSATTLGRLQDRAVYVIGAASPTTEVPQLWLYKDELLPARLLARRGGGLSDLRLLEYGTPASAMVFPRVLELWEGGRRTARFEALDAGTRRAGPASEDDDRD